MGSCVQLRVLASDAFGGGCRHLHQEKPNSRIRYNLVLTVIMTTYGPVKMENVEMWHTSMLPIKHTEITIVQGLEDALCDCKVTYWHITLVRTVRASGIEVR